MAANKLDGSMMEDVDASKLTGSVPSAALGNVDLSKLEYNQAILAFKVASANQLAKFSMVDQVIDEYQDATGIDAGNSTGEITGGSGTAKYYEGGTSSTPTVTGGTITTDGDYTIHKFTSSGNYITDMAQDVEYLVVAGGGGGGSGMGVHGGVGAGGGAGGYRVGTGFAVSAATHAVTVGTGGTGVIQAQTDVGDQGLDSVFSTITSNGGGGGASYHDSSALPPTIGGSGGGGSQGGPSGNKVGAAGNEGSFSPVEGHAGGDGSSSPPAGGGGGGASEVGGDAIDPVVSTGQGGTGGDGVQNDILVTGTNVYYAGGGAGGSYNGVGTGAGAVVAIGGLGGGGNGCVHPTGSTTAQDGTDGLGGGGGGGFGTIDGGDGGDGVVIIRRPTSTTSSGGNLTLQSVATTAETAPTTADLVVLIEDGAGTATVNTDIKGFVSRNGSAFSSAVTFVDEGDWGTNKRILVARNIDISGITTGTAMKYKLTTHNQVASSKETRIHATSLAWS